MPKTLPDFLALDKQNYHALASARAPHTFFFVEKEIFLVFHIIKEVYYFESKLIDLAKRRFKPLLGVKDPLMEFLKLSLARARKQAAM